MKMKIKSASSLILLTGILSYAALQIALTGPNATLTAGPQPQISSPQKTDRPAPAPHREKSPRHSQIYFATAR